MRLIVLVVGLGLMFSAMNVASAQSVYTPKRGSAERTAILDAVRPILESVTRGQVVFVVSRMSVLGDWAFIQVDPQRPGGGAVDLSRTGFGKEIEYMDGLTTHALLFRRQGIWRLIDRVIGPTDVAYLHWPDVYLAPRAIFGLD
ncbi:MAG: hypothetical protein AAF468_02245 [Pseudomonadota bacterium]